MKFRSYSFLIVLAMAVGFGSCEKKDTAYTPVTIFDDEFDNNGNNWAFNASATTGAAVYISSGYLNYSYHPANPGSNTVAVNCGLRLDHDFDIQTNITSNNAMALAYGVSPADYGYTFFVDKQGRYALYDEGTANIAPTAIINWTQASKSANNAYKLELQQQDGFWYGYINDTQVFKIASHAMYGAQVGFTVLDATDGSADYITVQQ